MPKQARRSLGEQVAEEIIEAVVAGDQAVGELLPPEWELAEQFGVSRLTVREAIGILRQKSVVRVQRGRGTLVLPFDEWSPLDPALFAAQASRGGWADRLRAVLETRRFVESGAAELAAQRRGDADLAAMETSLAAMREAGGDVDGFVEADMAFHDAVMTAAGNPVMAALFGPVRELLYRGRWATSRDPRARRSACAEHAAILEAIRRGEAPDAYRLMREHLRRTEHTLAEQAWEDDAPARDGAAAEQTPVGAAGDAA
ncbi:FadR/GntR family transcriptional regulator [Allostreptomyces psammosilenae]|uniref:DNA-binding FadR family transcriptional regulator n=1 Tax=Allostreptomyces psammosilenae TaxID=1892865 RepID=A0A852ZXE1_9ACTN|nr:FadR/GntR family transcriptional regulator [Allostreptomyces psammosilenae]NYI03301.1 DNA-binding FadR family transcriptional regulator [Allostreptomyces psammosilenae]